ncbi:MAG TPA: 1-acyl-sn-glycerol-3-phosphate acyltransferase [Flavisolibacter sp.]|nr:1-acyl-sn-glycerol-3-phosphate acyltransferase [Flavisolibacter sp.]
MLYALIKIYARLAIKVCCRKIVVNKPAVLSQKGPLLLAANHPNSFLDGMIMTTLFDEPVYSLARGDVFRKKWLNRLFRRMQLLPVYRTSEGVENLEHNYTTFASCLEVFKKNAVVLIFSEGRCENEWHLRPLKKGTARLALMTWETGLPLQVIPVAFNYSSFRNFGKEVHIYFGEPVNAGMVRTEETEGRRLLAFNGALKTQLEQYVYEIAPGEKDKRKKLFSIRRNKDFFLLLLPALAGWLSHAALFYPVKMFALFFRKSDHYDSVMAAMLLLLYPFYLVLAFLILFMLAPILSPLVVLFPFLARACVQFKYQLDI